VKHFAPAPPLRRFVRDLLVVEAPAEVTRLRLPEPGLVLGVRYRGAAELVEPAGAGVGPAAGGVRLPDASLAGLSDTARWMRTCAGGGVVLARFLPGGAARFFAEPLHELFGATAPLDAVIPAAESARVQAEMLEARDVRARIDTLERFLRRRAPAAPPDPLVEAGLAAITGARGAVRIAALARRLAISQDPFEKRFRRAVGASPKQFASLIRVRHAIASYRPGMPMAALAAEAGYHDESHFSRALRAMTGLPPARFFRGARNAG
jgi:AraC-like DNA-binding protein